MNTQAGTLLEQRYDRPTRRDFLYIATAAMAAAGGIVTVWPLVDNMNPSADVRAMAMTEIDLQPIETGQRVTVKWRGSPLFIVYSPAQCRTDCCGESR